MPKPATRATASAFFLRIDMSGITPVSVRTYGFLQLGLDALLCRLVPESDQPSATSCSQAPNESFGETSSGRPALAPPPRTSSCGLNANSTLMFRQQLVCEQFGSAQTAGPGDGCAGTPRYTPRPLAGPLVQDPMARGCRQPEE